MGETFSPGPPSPDTKHSLPESAYPPAEHAPEQSNQLEPRTFAETRNEWFDALGIDPTSVPRILLSRQQYALFSNAPAGPVHFVKDSLGASGNYAFVDIPPDGPDALPRQALVYLGDDQFGTALDPENLTPERARQQKSLVPAEVLPANTEFERSAHNFARNAARGIQAELEGAGIDEATWKSQCDTWLSAHGIKPAEVPQLSMSPAEYTVFVNMHVDQTQFVKRLYNIVDEDQLPNGYAYIEITPDNPDHTPTTRLVNVTEAAFGSTVSIQD